VRGTHRSFYLGSDHLDALGEYAALFAAGNASKAMRQILNAVKESNERRKNRNSAADRSLG